MPHVSRCGALAAAGVCILALAGTPPAAYTAGKGHQDPSHSAVIIPGRPRLQEETYQDCGPWGKGGDSISNYLRNRIDPASHPRALTFKQFLDLDVPHGAAMTPMRHWSSATRRDAYRYEGMAVSLQGYIATVKPGPPEQANCMGRAGYDWHIRLGTYPHASAAHTIITEATPRVRDREHSFSMKVLQAYAGHASRVRITGWLFLDNDHPTDLDRQRATLWEIHPVTRIEVWRVERSKGHTRRQGHWVTVAG